MASVSTFPNCGVLVICNTLLVQFPGRRFHGGTAPVTFELPRIGGSQDPLLEPPFLCLTPSPSQIADSSRPLNASAQSKVASVASGAGAVLINLGVVYVGHFLQKE
jgi:hypothetical protein